MMELIKLLSREIENFIQDIVVPLVRLIGSESEGGDNDNDKEKRSNPSSNPRSNPIDEISRVKKEKIKENWDMHMDVELDKIDDFWPFTGEFETHQRDRVDKVDRVLHSKPPLDYVERN